MNDLKPSQSTVASLALGGAVAVLVAWSLKQFWGIEFGSVEQSAVTTIITVLVGVPFKGGRASDVKKPE